MESREDPRDFHRCDICGYVTQSLFDSLKHQRQHSIKLGLLNVYACYCNVLDIYKCKNCNFETNLKVSLTYHSNINHKNLKNENQFRNVLRQCGYCCDFETYSMLLLLKHYFRCYKRENLEADEKSNGITNWLECGQCSHKTKEKGYLRRHIMRTHSTNFTWLHCEECSFKTKNKQYLRKHLKRHGAKRGAKYHIVWHHCDKCDFTTKWKVNLKQHIANIHRDSANIVWYHCDKCEHKTKRKTNLNRHIENIHTDTGNIAWYHCDKCEYKSNVKCNLTKHIANIHTDSSKIVWYHCDKCKYKTKWKVDLKKHITVMHTDSANIVWYRCDICEYKSKQKVYLTRHTILSIHENIVLTICKQST